MSLTKIPFNPRPRISTRTSNGQPGAQRGNKNAVKHGLFSSEFSFLEFEIKQDFDDLVLGLEAEYKPDGELEVQFVHEIAEERWALKRIARLEINSIKEAQFKGDYEMKFLATYSLYRQRTNRALHASIKKLEDHQAARLHNFAQLWRTAVLMYAHCNQNNLNYKELTKDYGFVFSEESLAKQLHFNEFWNEVVKDLKNYIATGYQEDFFAPEAL